MGVYLSTPSKKIDGGEGAGRIVEWSYGSMQGWRKAQEDGHIALDDLSKIVNVDDDESLKQIADLTREMGLFAVFDGKLRPAKIVPRVHWWNGSKLFGFSGLEHGDDSPLLAP